MNERGEVKEMGVGQRCALCFIINVVRGSVCVVLKYYDDIIGSKVLNKFNTSFLDIVRQNVIHNYRFFSRAAFFKTYES